MDLALLPMAHASLAYSPDDVHVPAWHVDLLLSCAWDPPSKVLLDVEDLDAEETMWWDAPVSLAPPLPPQAARGPRADVDATDIMVAFRISPDVRVDAQVGYALTGTWDERPCPRDWGGGVFVEPVGRRPVLLVNRMRWRARDQKPHAEWMAAGIQRFLRRHRGKRLHTCGHTGRDHRAIMAVLELAYAPFGLLEVC